MPLPTSSGGKLVSWYSLSEHHSPLAEPDEAVVFLESTKEKVCIKYATSLRGVCQLACTHDHVMYTYQLVVMIFTLHVDAHIVNECNKTQALGY